MVAVINFSGSLKNVINYNENKLKQDTGEKDANGHAIKKAEFIHASGYAKDTNKLSFTDRFKRIEKQMKLNENRAKSVTHISLNFDPSEKEKLDKETLIKLADTYMKKIGFGGQPYLVYQHNDAGHPHIHLVSTIIKNDGSPIQTHRIGKNVSEPVCREMEKNFGLVQADKIQKKEVNSLAVTAQKALMGKSVTKRAITNVLDAVLPTYKYTSLAELNAILKQYNVVADGGAEGSRIQKNKGLVYHVIDEIGNKTAAIKASAIYSNPGLKYLEQRFEKNKTLREPFKARIKNEIDLALSRPSVTNLVEFKEALRKQKIQLVVRQNNEGRIYGITFIDYSSKCVFNGSDIGKQYSASHIEERLLNHKITPKETIQKQSIEKILLPEKEPTQKAPQTLPTAQRSKQTMTQKDTIQATPMTKVDYPKNELLQELIKREYGTDSVPSELKRKKKRKKKRLHL